MFECTGTGKFADVARPLGCDAIEDSRGVAIADLNDDGLLDIVVNNNNAPPAIYVSQLAEAGHWLRLSLVGRAGSNRDAIGARVQVTLDVDGQPRKLTRWVEAGTGYAAQSDSRPHFGLGKATRIEKLTVTWPDGTSDEFGSSELEGRINSTIRIEQGGAVEEPGGHIYAGVRIKNPR